MKSTTPIPSLYICLLGLLVFAATLYGQIPTGAVQGNVTDPTSAVVQGAEVLLKNEETGIQRVATTSDQGIYSFNYLDSGTYRLTVKRAGFQTAIYPGIVVRVGDKVRVDVPLAVGEVTSTVEVSGGGALVQTDTAVVGNVISRREVTEMPVRGREFSQLATLLPGVRATGTTGGALITQFATAITVGGTSGNKNNYTVDGVDNTFNVWNGPAMNPSIDSIQEFRIDRSLFSAEFGRGGAQLHLVTKAGTNQYHGVLWEYLRNRVLNAGNYVSHRRDNVIRNQYGANLGGPIRRNKLFFFFNWESQRERSSVQPLGTVFTDAMRRGDLAGYPKVVTDPNTGQPFPGNVIPTSRLNPLSLSLMDSMLARANLPGFQNNLIRPFTTSRDWNQYIGRVDYQISSKDTLFVRISQQPRRGISAPLAATSINHNEDFNFINGGIGWTRIWSSRLISETRFGDHYERLLLQSQPLATVPTRAIRGFGSIQPPSERLPVVSIADTSGFHQWGFPLGFQQNAWEFVQNVTYARGKHIIKGGFSGNTVSLKKNKSPEYQFTMGFTGDYTGTGPGDFLLGLPFTANQSLGFVTLKQNYGNYSFFIQDDWKILPSLTVNVGLRYELSTLPSEASNLWGSFNPERQKVVVAGDKIVARGVPDPFILQSYQNYLIPASQTDLPQRTLVFGDHNNFAPRIGIAWRPFPDNKTVVRGGYGIYYLLQDGNIAFNNTGSIPYGGVVSIVNTKPRASFSIDDPFSAGVAALPAPGAFFRDPRMRTSYLQQFSFGVQRELPWRMVAEANFQDQNSKKLESSWNMNQPPAGAGALNPRRPFQTFGPSIGGTFREGYSRYNALELIVRKQSRHYTFQWSHTWAKTMGRGTVVDPFNRDIFYGPGDYVPHLDKVHFVLDLPFGSGRKWLSHKGVVNQVLGGWTLSGFAILHQSGGLLTPVWNGDVANVGVGSVRPNRVGSGVVSNPTPNLWIDPSAFVAPTPFTFGNAGTGIIQGPSARFFDASILKNFAIKEGVRLQFRTELFNLLNHPNLNNPNLAVNGLAFGKILLKNQDPRVIQFALRLEF